MKPRVTTVAGAVIESLDRWERVPGEYFVLRIGDSVGAMVSAANLLTLAGGTIATVEGTTTDARVRISGFQWREQVLRAGDYVTFRRLAGGGWSVITYRQADFESRYRRARTRTSPIGEVSAPEEDRDADA